MRSMKPNNLLAMFLFFAAPLFTPVICGAQTAHDPAGNPAPVASTEKEASEFRRTSTGEMQTPYGVHLGFTNFRASDGVGLVLFYLAEGGKDQAALAFDHEVARASKIVQRAA